MQRIQQIRLVWVLLLALSWSRRTSAWPKVRTFEPIGSEKCVDRETGRELLVGDVFHRIGRCIRVQCLGDLTLWEDKCSAPNLEGDCVEVPPVNINLPYPRCCPLYECQKVLDHGNFKELRVHDHYGNLLLKSVTQLFTITQYDQNNKVTFN